MHTMRALPLCFVLLLLAGCAPDNIAGSSCQDHPLTTADEHTCTLHGELVTNVNSMEFKTDSRNHIGHVAMAVQVTKGSLHIRYYDLTGAKDVVVTPSEPANIVMQTRMHRERRSFTVMFDPANSEVQGLTGTVKYSTP